MKSHYLFSLLLILTIHSCTESTPLPTIPDPPTELPEITTEGLNTFGCLKDGELWLPKGLHSLFNDNPNASWSAVDAPFVGSGQTLNNENHTDLNATNVSFLLNNVMGSSGFRSNNPLDQPYNFGDSGMELGSGTFVPTSTTHYISENLEILQNGRIDINVLERILLTTVLKFTVN